MENKFENRIDLSDLSHKTQSVRTEIAKYLVGQPQLVDLLLIALLADGHVLIEGVPGVAKTLTAKLLAKTIDAEFKRIQFTPDLMPSDIIGTSIFNAKNSDFEFKRGPLFANIVLTDEINRSPAKTQSALFEAMEERQITVDGNTYKLDLPFMVLATQNPIEQEGTYPLPEAQLDRFLFKLVVGYSNREELNTIIDRTTKGTIITPEKVMDGEEIRRWQQLVRQVVLAKHVQDYIARLILATHPEGALAPEVTNQYIRWGASPRGAQTIALAAKVRALLDGRYNVSFEDVRRVYLPAMRHRVLLNFEAQAEGIQCDKVLLDILEKVTERADDLVAA